MKYGCRQLICFFVLSCSLVQAQTSLVAHWPLASNSKDIVSGTAAANHGVVFKDGVAHFDGRKAWLEVAADAAPKLGNSPFTISAWVHTAEDLDDVLGDVMTSYDTKSRTGFNLTLMNFAGVTSHQSNWRNILFGIDESTSNKWQDCGRPGANQYVTALAVFQGDLYASTWEPAEGDRGHVYRYGGKGKWIDCGAPDKCNTIGAMGVYKGRLYIGSSLYSGGGSSLPLSPNKAHGGTVFRYEGGKKWTNVGKIADNRAIGGFASFKGKLYAGTGTTGAWRDMPRTRGMYRYDGEGKWFSCGCPGLRVVHLHVFNGDLFGLSYDGGGFFRYKGGTDWQRLGPVPDTTQVYSAAVYEGEIHCGTWPTGSVFRYGGPQKWHNTGRLGEEKEVMGMSVYNGKLYAGTLPLAAVYRYDGQDKWTSTGRLDLTPDVRYRRAWSMAVFDGKLFCGVLPSGRVRSLEAGKCVTYDHILKSGWRHIVAVRGARELKLYVDGELVANSSAMRRDFDLGSSRSWKIGFGSHDYFNGRMRDVRVYRGALESSTVADLYRKTK